MRTILTSDITANVGMPGKAKTLGQLCIADFEVGQMIIQSMFPGYVFDPAKLYIVEGGQNTGAGANYIIAAAIVYYNGELFFMDAATFTAADTAVAVVDVSYYTGVDGDPFTFTDGSTHNILAIRKIQIIDGNSGSTGYVADYANALYMNDPWHSVGGAGQPAFQNGWVNAGGSAQVLQFKKNKNKVSVRGLIKSGTLNSIVFTLPATAPDGGSYRPILNQVVAGSAGPSNAVTPAYYSINSSGAITLFCNAGADVTSVPFTFEFNSD